MQFDSSGDNGNNHSVGLAPRRSAILLVLVTMGTPCLSVCAGWMRSSHEHMACCVEKTEAEAEACCATGEAQQNADLLTTVLSSAVPAPQPVASVMSREAPAVARAPFDRTSYAPLISDSERHVVLSIFLI